MVLLPRKTPEAPTQGATKLPLLIKASCSAIIIGSLLVSVIQVPSGDEGKLHSSVFPDIRALDEIPSALSKIVGFDSDPNNEDAEDSRMLRKRSRNENGRSRNENGKLPKNQKSGMTNRNGDGMNRNGGGRNGGGKGKGSKNQSQQVESSGRAAVIDLRTCLENVLSPPIDDPTIAQGDTRSTKAPAEISKGRSKGGSKSGNRGGNGRNGGVNKAGRAKSGGRRNDNANENGVGRNAGTSNGGSKGKNRRNNNANENGVGRNGGTSNGGSKGKQRRKRKEVIELRRALEDETPFIDSQEEEEEVVLPWMENEEGLGGYCGITDSMQAAVR